MFCLVTVAPPPQLDEEDDEPGSISPVHQMHTKSASYAAMSPPTLPSTSTSTNSSFAPVNHITRSGRTHRSSFMPQGPIKIDPALLAMSPKSPGLPSERPTLRRVQTVSAKQAALLAGFSKYKFSWNVVSALSPFLCYPLLSVTSSSTSSPLLCCNCPDRTLMLNIRVEAAKQDYHRMSISLANYSRQRMESTNAKTQEPKVEIVS